jgi:hypothetical protein
MPAVCTVHSLKCFHTTRWFDSLFRFHLHVLVEKSNYLIGSRARDLPACSIVPQPPTLPRGPTQLHKLTLNSLSHILGPLRGRHIGYQFAQTVEATVPSFLRLLLLRRVEDNSHLPPSKPHCNWGRTWSVMQQRHMEPDWGWAMSQTDHKMCPNNATNETLHLAPRSC